MFILKLSVIQNLIIYLNNLLYIICYILILKEDVGETVSSDDHSGDSKSKVYRFFQDMKLKATALTDQDDN